jgi:glycosyltransferase involved in cell wall biosynthesis
VNLLMLSLDTSLAVEPGAAAGDSRERHVLYGKYLTSLHIVVYSPRSRHLAPRQLADNVFVYPTNSRKWCFPWDACRLAKKVCREYPIDVVTTQDPLSTGLAGYLIRRKFGVPLNVQLHGDYLANPWWIKTAPFNRVLNLLGKYIVKRSDTVRVVSRKVADRLQRRLGIPGEKITVLPVYTTLCGCADAPVPPDARFSGYSHVILFVGRLAGEKDLPLLLAAFRQVLLKFSRALLVLVGEGPQREALVKTARELGIGENLLLTGAVPHDTLPEYYAACDVFVLPSIHEGWGRVAIEAMSCGKPVVVTDGCGVAETVAAARCGDVVPVHDTDKLSESIMKLLDDPEAAREMGSRGRDFAAEQLDGDTAARKYREMFNTTLARAGERR